MAVLKEMIVEKGGQRMPTVGGDEPAEIPGNRGQVRRRQVCRKDKEVDSIHFVLVAKAFAKQECRVGSLFDYDPGGCGVVDIGEASQDPIRVSSLRPPVHASSRTPPPL